MSPESAKSQNAQTQRCLVLASGASDLGAGDWWERGPVVSGYFGEKSESERESLSVKVTGSEEMVSIGCEGVTKFKMFYQYFI